MFASLRLIALLFGISAGGLIITISALVIWLPLELLSVENPSFIAILIGTVLGMIGGGWVSAKLAGSVFGLFHGSVTGLGLSALLVVISGRGGSSASLGSTLLLLAMGIGLGRLGAWWAGRSRPHAESTETESQASSKSGE